MPIYEFRCGHCRRPFSLFTRAFQPPADPECPYCHAHDARRLISRFAVVRSEERRLDDMTDDHLFDGLDEKDPKSIARWARKMSQEMGEEMPPELNEMVDRLEAGEAPEKIEAEMGLSEGMGGTDVAGGTGGMDDL